MMREILFRGKRLIDNCWQDGSLLYWNDIYLDEIDNERCHICQQILDEDGSISIIPWEVNPDTVNQYTNLIDKNGKKIFEGDIVRFNFKQWRDKFDESIIGKVIYDCGSFAIETDIGTYYRWMDYDVEVIGNIYDNLELMEEESDA